MLVFSLDNTMTEMTTNTFSVDQSNNNFSTIVTPHG